MKPSKTALLYYIVGIVIFFAAVVVGAATNRPEVMPTGGVFFAVAGWMGLSTDLYTDKQQTNESKEMQQKEEKENAENAA